MGTIEINGQKINAAASLIELDRVECRESLMAFVKRSWHIIEPGQPYTEGWHLHGIAEHLEAITDEFVMDDGTLYNRLLANIPPGTMKSLMVSVFWPAWEWGPCNMPHLRYITASHSLDIAIRDTLRMRRLVQSDWYMTRWPHVRMTSDQNAKTNFENTMGGWRQAAASGGITGKRGDRVIIDDPLSVDDGNSDQVRGSVNTWFREAVPLRVNNPDKSAIVVIMQRLHEDDVSGVILEDKLGYDHLCLPMRYASWRAGTKTKIGYEDPRREEGQLLFPARFPLHVVERDEKILGPYATAGQFAQEPAPRGGGIIKNEWWQLWEGKEYPPFDYIIGSLDTAFTEKTENDPSAMTVWGVFTGASALYAANWASPGGRMLRQEGSEEMFDLGQTVRTKHSAVGGDAPRVMLAYAWAERLPLHELVQKVAKTCKDMKVDKLLIENKASGYSVAQEMRRLFGHEDWGVQLLDPKGMDKLSRLYAVQHLFAEGMIYAPDKVWAQQVIQEVSVFPKGKHDDLCLVAGTKIATRRGSIPIERVTTADEVLTPLGWRKVEAAGCTGAKPVVSAKSLTGTANHPVFTLDNMYQPLDSINQESLTVGLGLCDLVKTQRRRKLFSTVSHTAAWVESGGTTSANPGATRGGAELKGCTLRSGKKTPAALFHRSTTYTTEMVTCLILALIIWSAYRKACIGACLRKLIGKRLRPTWRAYAPSPVRGTSQKRGGIGIAGLALFPWLRLERRGALEMSVLSSACGLAIGVGPSLSSEARERLCARPHASYKSPLINLESASTHTPITQPVYNLTVEGAHCYYANGMLVHNCDTVSQGISHLRQLGLLTRAPEWAAEVTGSMQFNHSPGPIYPV